MGNVEGTVTHRWFQGRIGLKEERAVHQALNRTSLSEVDKAVHYRYLLDHKYLFTGLARHLDDDEAFLDYLQTHVRPESVQEWNEWAEEARQVMEADQEQREDTYVRGRALIAAEGLTDSLMTDCRDVSGADEVLPHIDDELLPTGK